ncbi:MAG: dimethylarginine dimethylaminohydrolase family protein [Sphaerimonospora mesophila]
MINQRILVSGADYFALDAPINPYYDDEPVNVAQATSDHTKIVQAFEQAGMGVVKITPPQDSQDGVYTANWALVRDNKAVLSRLPDARKAEEAHAAKVLSDLGIEVIMVPESWRFSGQGDALPCGRFLLAGQGYRSDPRAQAFAAETLGYELVQLQTLPQLDATGQPQINAASGWPDSFFYDIDLALAVLRDDLIAYCPEAFDSASQAKIAELPMDKIEVSYDEAVKGFACNLVSTGETVIMSGHAPKLQAAIESHGLKTITPDVQELPRGGGYIRCVSLTLN